jgi:hypothetical protein
MGALFEIRVLQGVFTNTYNKPPTLGVFHAVKNPKGFLKTFHAVK